MQWTLNVFFFFSLDVSRCFRLCFSVCLFLVHGEWAQWNNWEGCSVPCGTGIQRRHRTCTHPAPSLYGRYCLGDPVEYDTCTGVYCANSTTTREFYKTISLPLMRFERHLCIQVIPYDSLKLFASPRTSSIVQVIFFSVFCDQRGYSEKSEIYYRLRFLFLPMFNTFGFI